ncbi:MAG: hydrogenase nickel incorporation protein HypB [Desulfuromonadales bacterium]|nr:hydrogenase nickel incorporation protein HypB [Desulfuromonadales bacterium]
MCEETHSHQHSGHRLVVEPQQSLLSNNDHLAAHIRKRLDNLGIRGINLMGSPGSGKTALLEALIDQYPHGNLAELAVLEGDLATSRDADRINNRGVKAQQITTGSACHLSASMVAEALIGVSLEGVKTLFIENVGNLVCPSKFALGTHKNVVAVSIPEGDDKPIKYPVMIRVADIVVLTKADLLPHFDFNVERCRQEIEQINHHAQVLVTSAKTGEGISELWQELQS